MKNKILVVIIILLVPISLLINPQTQKQQETQPKQEIIVHLQKDNEILNLNLFDYLVGVVGAEMPASFPFEALKAQSIASRTFALSSLQENNEINTTLSSQSYKTNEELKQTWQNNYDTYYNKIKQAVEATNNLVITYDNQIIKSYYFAMSNGKTTSSLPVFNEELPYIESVESTFEEQNKSFQITTTFTYQNFCESLNISPCENITITDIQKDNTNRITSLKVNNNEYKGTIFRKLLNLRSTDFEIKLNPENIDITTKGYGHGVGMSQYGASYLANKGYNYEEIIKYYYKNVEIKNFTV